jgi:hypothetical protein
VAIECFLIVNPPSIAEDSKLNFAYTMPPRGTNNPNPKTNFTTAILPVIREREKKPSEKGTTEKPHCQGAIA